MGVTAAGAAVVGAGAALYGATKSNKSSGGQLSPAAEANAWDQRQHGNEMYDYYKANYQPLEGQAIDMASQAGSPQMQEARAGRAGADVKQQTALANTDADRSLASVGVNPGSGKYLALRQQGAVTEGANVAGAMNAGREAERQYGLSAKLDTAALGKGLVGNSIASSSASTNSLNTAGHLNAQSHDIQSDQARNIGVAANGIASIARGPSTSGGQSGIQANGNWNGVGTPPANLQYDQTGNFNAPAYDGTGTADTANYAYFNKGGKIRSLPLMKRDHKHGGTVTGPGTGTSDSVPVKIDGDTPGALSSGEYVVNTKAVRKFGVAKLDKINKLGLPPGHRMKNGTHLATGGKVELDTDTDPDDDDSDDNESQKYAKGGAVRKYLKARAKMNMQEGGQVDTTMRRTGYKEDNAAEKLSGNGFVRG